MVYLIDFETCYKIGTTLNLKRRLKQFRNSRENVICIDLIIINSNLLDPSEDDSKIELELHRRCEKYKITREMFQKIPEIKEIFKAYKAELGNNIDYSAEINKIMDELDSKNKDDSLGKLTNKEKPVFQYSMDGKYINRYESRAKAERANNIYRGKIKEVIGKRHLTAGGYIWSDYELTKEEIIEKVNKINSSKVSKLQGNKKLNQYTKDNTFIKCWNTMSEASRELGVPVSSISLCCKGNYKTAGGFVWRIE